MADPAASAAQQLQTLCTGEHQHAGVHAARAAHRLVMAVVLGAQRLSRAQAGMTIAATYRPRSSAWRCCASAKAASSKKTSRTVGSIGESVAAGAIFTIPAFVILQIWQFRQGGTWSRSTPWPRR